MYENSAKTISADQRLKAAYMTRLKGAMPSLPNIPGKFFDANSSSPSSFDDTEEDPDLAREIFVYPDGGGVSDDIREEDETGGDN